MSIAGIAIAVLLALIALALVMRPLLAPAPPEPALSDRRDRLRDYYERVLTNIRDLDEDFATGKINRGDYHEEREVWLQRGIRLLRAQDELEREQSAADAERVERALEEARAAYRASAAEEAE